MPKSPDDLTAAVAHFHAGRRDEALALAAEHEIENAVGTEHVKRSELDAAEHHYRRAIALSPGFFKPHNNLGNVLRERGRLEEAVEQFRAALAIEPSAQRVHANLGNTLSELGLRAEAVEAYRKALALQGNAPVAIRLGKLLEELGDREQAVLAYGRAAELGDATAAAEQERIRRALEREGQAPRPRDPRADLMLLSDVAGMVFGTEDFCLFLYSLVRMHAPKTVVELGTGLGASAFWMALAAKRNGVGHVFTVDDLTLFKQHKPLLDELLGHLRRTAFPPFEARTPEQYFQAATRILDLGAHLTFLHRGMDLTDAQHFDGYPFAGAPIDLLFSDFRHGPADILSLLGHFLPRMAPASSILIDSAPTSWPSYLLLEQLVAQLDRGQIPVALQERCRVDLGPVMKNRRVVLVHLTEWKERDQNSTAWLKIEPVDLFPQPRATMH
jgi:tetratricopeptide (TPR) repeat protein